MQRHLRPRIIAALALCLAATALSGCATAIVGGITLGEISAAAGIASVSTTGKGLQDHALSAVTGQDCRVLEGIFRQNRRICEEPGSPATEHDFRGVVAMLQGGPDPDAADSNAEPEVLYTGSASDDGPSLARTQRRSPAPAIEDLIDEQPAQLAGPLTAPIVPQLPAATALPSAAEWASAQPAPSLIPPRWQSD